MQAHLMHQHLELRNDNIFSYRNMSHRDLPRARHHRNEPSVSLPGVSNSSIAIKYCLLQLRVTPREINLTNMETLHKP